MRFSLRPVFAWCLAFVICGNAQAQYEFTAPENGSKYHDIHRNIIIRPGEILQPSSIKKSAFSIEGSQSGHHNFDITFCRDEKTIILQPASSFGYNEQVTVKVNSQLKNAVGNKIPGYTFSFFIQPKFTSAQEEQMKEAMKQSQDLPTDQPVNETTAPQTAKPYTILVNKDPAPGRIFFSTFSGLDHPGKRLWIIDNNGDSVFSQQTPHRTYDFKINHIGYLTVFDSRLQSFDVLDSNFVKVAHFHCQNGYFTDDHEFQIFPDRHSFIIGDQYVAMQVYPVDSSWSHSALVTENVVEELDQDGNEIFEWRSVDHVGVNEAWHENLYAGFIDAVHLNAIERDADGNILISCRKLDQIDKIDLKTGNFIWRLGGQKNEFTFINDPAKFNYQHDIRRLANGDITLFDNGQWHVPSQAFAKEYKLDEVNRTATLVWSYAHPNVNGKPVNSTAEGNVQRLSNGNTLINWGWIPYQSGFPNVTEVDASGNIVWEMQCEPSQWNIIYRAFKFDWNPCSRPSARKINATVLNNTSAEFNWNQSSGAFKYFIEYKAVDAANWNNLIADANRFSVTVNDLIPNTKYEWKIQTWCDSTGNAHSGFTDPMYFQTGEEKNVSSTHSFSLFPNPASDEIFISIPEWNATAPCHLCIEDALGNVVQQEELKSDGEGNSVMLSVSNLKNGIYFLKLITANASYSKKFLKVD